MCDVLNLYDKWIDVGGESTVHSTSFRKAAFELIIPDLNALIHEIDSTQTRYCFPAQPSVSGIASQDRNFVEYFPGAYTPNLEGKRPSQNIFLVSNNRCRIFGSSVNDNSKNS